MPRNPQTTAIVAVSLPVPMAKQIERTRKAEQRSRSELVREALRDYFRRAAGFPVVTATPRRTPRPETCPPRVPLKADGLEEEAENQKLKGDEKHVVPHHSDPHSGELS